MKIIRFLLTAAHLVILALLLGTLLNSAIAPKTFPWINVLSLTFAPLMILNVCLIILWVILTKKRALFFLAVSLLLINPTRRWLNFTGESTEKANLKIVTMNIKGGGYGREAIYEYLNTSGADVVLAQEHMGELKVPGYSHRTDAYELIALNSKTEILHQEKIKTSENGEAFFADIRINGKTIRFVNIYLNPFSFDKSKVKPSEDYDNNKRKLRYILSTLIPTFKAHQDEVTVIKKTIAESPYPVIVAGDFNAVPNSYEYYQLSENLKDVFLETGNGHSTSFHDYKIPIRIDYVFCSEEITPVRYTVDRRAKMSDHYPVIAEFKIN